MYLARPWCGGSGQAACTEQDALDGNLYQLYLELGGTGPLADTGINIKAHGYVEANPATGQFTTKFLENPQAPFSELHIDLNGGPRAPLDNPAVCGAAVTTSDLTPWSAPGYARPKGSRCRARRMRRHRRSSTWKVARALPGLQPGFSAGTVTPQAGAVQRVHAELLPPGPRTVRQGYPGAYPAGAAGDALERPAVRRTGSRRRALSRSVEDRHDTGSRPVRALTRLKSKAPST